MGMFTPTITASQILSALSGDSIQIAGSTTRPIFVFDPKNDTPVKIAGVTTLLGEVDTNYKRGWIWRKSVATDETDKWSLGHLYIPISGTYTAIGLFETNTDSGKVTIYLNGVSKGTLDCYAGALVNDAIVSGSLGTLTAGFYTVGMGTPTKHASSTGYNWRMSGFAIYKTI